jgi:site-specific recombinase XerD
MPTTLTKPGPSLSELADCVREFIGSKCPMTQTTYRWRFRAFAKFLGFRSSESIRAIQSLVSMPPRKAEEKVVAFKALMKARSLSFRRRANGRYGIRPFIDHLGKQGYISWTMTRPGRDKRMRAWTACPQDLRDQAEKWLGSLSIYNYAPNTLLTLRKNVVYLGLFLRDREIPLRKLRLQGALDYTDHLRSLTAAPATTNFRIAIAKRFYEWLRRQHYLPVNPFATCGRMKYGFKLPRALDENEVRRVIRAAKTPLEKALVEFLYATGARTGELLGLTLTDLTLEESRVTLTCPGGYRRTVPLHDHAVRALGLYLKERSRILREHHLESETALFVLPCGRLNFSRMSRLLRRLGQAAGVGRRVTAFLVRNSFAVHLLDRGADPFVVKELMGHSTFGSVDRYGRLTTRNMRRVFERTHPREAGRR